MVVLKPVVVNKPYVLTSIEKSTRDVTTFRFESKEKTSVHFIPGMFAMLTYKDPETGKSISRAFSIANAPPSDYFEFFIAMINGQLTSKLADAKVNDVYYISAPYGQFQFDINAGTKFLFLAGGTGVAPFFSMLRQAESMNKKLDCSMIYSVKYPYDIIEKEEIEKFEKDMDLKNLVTVTRPAEGDGWTGQTGRINGEMIKKFVPDFLDRIIYICGPPAFVTALKNDLIAMGANDREIRAEMWGE